MAFAAEFRHQRLAVRDLVLGDGAGPATSTASKAATTCQIVSHGIDLKPILTLNNPRLPNLPTLAQASDIPSAEALEREGLLEQALVVYRRCLEECDIGFRETN